MSDQNLYGLDAAQQRNATGADVIDSIETTSGGDTLMSVGRVALLADKVGRYQERSLVRLSPADRDRPIDALTLARQVTA